MGVVVACSRSRAGPFNIIVQLRKLCALGLIMNSKVHFGWIPSELNSSDEASRILEIEGPTKQDILAHLDDLYKAGIFPVPICLSQMTSRTIIYLLSLQITHTFLDQLQLILPLRNPKLASLPPTMMRGRPPEPRQATRTRRATPASSTPRPAMPAAARSRVLKRQSQSVAVPAVRVGRARVVSRRDIAPRLSGQKYPRIQFLEEAVALAMEMTKREQAMDSDDDGSSDAPERCPRLPARGSDSERQTVCGTISRRC